MRWNPCVLELIKSDDHQALEIMVLESQGLSERPLDALIQREVMAQAAIEQLHQERIWRLFCCKNLIRRLFPNDYSVQ
jgi:hypothetical protein